MGNLKNFSKLQVNTRSSHPEVFCKKMFLKILQISQKNVFTGVPFLIKLQAGNLKLSEAATGNVLFRSFSYFLLQVFFSQFCYTLIFIYKQLGSGLSPQSWLYFQGFMGSKLLNVCSAVWPNNLCLRGIQNFRIQNQHL